MIHYKNKKKSPITKEWYPEIDALEILLKADIPKKFVENQLPEFILYWSEKGQLTDTWNSKFIAHVRRQWAKNNSIIDWHIDQCLDDNQRTMIDFYHYPMHQ